MPQIGPNRWKAALSFFWWREYLDGRIEGEFDLETGQIRLWGSKTPEGLKRAGWLPVTPDLAAKMQAFGEFGEPTHAPAMFVELQPDDELVIYKEPTVYKLSYRCKACGLIIRECNEPAQCPACGSTAALKCDKCQKLVDSETCPNCKMAARPINPIDKLFAPWEEVVYFLGIKGRFLQKFNAKQSIIT